MRIYYYIIIIILSIAQGTLADPLGHPSPKPEKPARIHGVVTMGAQRTPVSDRKHHTVLPRDQQLQEIRFAERPWD